MNERIKEFFSKLKKGKALFIIGVVGILLIGASSFLPSGTKKEAQQGIPLNTEEYCTVLEKKVKQTVAAITGNNDVSVAITLESSVRYSYADEVENSSSEKVQQSATDKTDELRSSYITVKLSDGSESALLITEYMPEIRGVTVVCRGGNSGAIENAVTAMLGITSRRLCVVTK